ncbi:energy-coupling factor transporter transmembrane component T family protein [Nocardioides currus]|uniref:Cobalt ABC transporter n=1 Tax=Nocardioides currus TaxID=2133958 RepID=A0A2R7YUH0_9ACTN|nr:energy-coupling factor transporter transmembrane protein EcfT [Nocardioides currus]PUA80015.1 cobalt ABC transporter [Nocardioides currus]
MSTSLGLYRPGTSPVHRTPAGVKLAVVVAAGIGSVFVRTPAVAGVLLAVVLVAYTVARTPPGLLWHSVRPLCWVLVPLMVFQVLTAGWARASVIVGVIVTLVLLANLVTLTTRTTELVDVVVRLAAPLRFLGVDPERVGLVLNLGIRGVPLVLELATEVREAQHARGQAASARAFAVPLIVGALRRSDEIGEALAARGFDD